MKNSSLTTITDIILIALAFVFFIQTLCQIKDSVTIKKKMLEGVFTNTEIPPIDTIEIGRNHCYQDNEYQTIFNYTFTGIKGGSYNTLTEEFSDKNCPTTGFYPCTNVPTIKNEFLSIWLDKAICIKRIKQQPLFIAKQYDCPEGTRQCGIISNEFNDKVCYNSIYLCPYNYITIKDHDEIDFNDPKFDYILLNKNKYLVSSRQYVNDTLPIDFVMSEGYPCIQKEKILYNLNYGVFPRMNGLGTKFGCNITRYQLNKNEDFLYYYDYRYKNISIISKKAFLFDNDLINKYSLLPDTPNWKNDALNDSLNNITLFHRS